MYLRSAYLAAGPLADRIVAAAESKQSIAVVPIAIPLLAGPGAISTVIIQIHRPGAPYHQALVIAIILVVALLLWVVLGTSFIGWVQDYASIVRRGLEAIVADMQGQMEALDLTELIDRHLLSVDDEPITNNE